MYLKLTPIFVQVFVHYLYKCISLQCPNYKEPCLVDCLDKKRPGNKSRIASDKLYNQQVCIEGRVNQGDRKHGRPLLLMVIFTDDPADKV